MTKIDITPPATTDATRAAPRVPWAAVITFLVIAYGGAWLIAAPLWRSGGLQNPLFLPLGLAVPAVLVITTFDLDEYVFGALEAGASGFLLKDAEPDELVAAVRRLADGSGLLDQAVTRRVIAEFARRHAVPESGAAAHGLTAREADIVRVLAQGRSNEEIARELFIETSTVKSHLTRAMAKIGTRERLQTVVWAYRNGVAQIADEPR